MSRRALTLLLLALSAAQSGGLVSPSARVALGRLVDAGTGAFDCWTPLAKHT